MAGTPFRNDGHKQALQPDEGDLRWTIVTCGPPSPIGPWTASTAYDAPHAVG